MFGLSWLKRRGLGGEQDKGLNAGLDNDTASFLLAVIGIANTVGRIILGYVSDKPWINRLWLYNTALTVCGLGNTPT